MIEDIEAPVAEETAEPVEAAEEQPKPKRVRKVTVKAEEAPEQPAEAEDAPVAPEAPAEPAKPQYKACRRLRMGGHSYNRGDIIPGAENWTRREAWERAGYIKEA